MRLAVPTLSLFAGLAACSGQVGTVSVSLVTAPGSKVLDPATQLRLVVTSPHSVTTVDRTANGFALEVDLSATGGNGQLIVDALDDTGATLATGESPPIPEGAIDATVAIYMAAPLSIAAAPATLTPARTELGATAMSYGAVLAGGRDGAGAANDALVVYNAYNHTLLAGMAMPAPRAGMAVGVGGGGIVYLFGGADTAGAAHGSFLRFDTNTAPAGAYVDYGDKAGFARADQIAVPIGSDQFMVSGTPAAQLGGLDGSLTAITDVPSLPPAGATVAASDGTAIAIFAGAGGIVRFQGGAFDTLDTTDQTGASVVAIPGTTTALVACGAGDAKLVDAAAGTVTTAAAVPHFTAGCALAATSRHVIAAADATAHLLSADLVYLAPLPLLVPRTGASAIALPNEQIMIVGGTTQSETIELFTPDALE